MKSIAVTGTKGKSTTLQLLQTVLLSLKQNVYCSCGVDGFFYNGKMIRDGANCSRYLEIDSERYPTEIHLSEATSFVLNQGFYDNSVIDFGVFTSFDITEHEELHKEPGSYLQAKKKLFELIRTEGKMLVNRDMTNFHEVISGYEHLVISYGTHPESDYRIVLKSITQEYMMFQIIHDKKVYKFKTLLLGEFNAKNMAAVFIVSRLMGCPQDKVIASLQLFTGFSGRLERYKIPARNNIVIIDFAHSYKSLEALLLFAKQVYQRKKIIVIFGCSGGTSKSKRPLMAGVADSVGDFTILTSNDPKDESPLQVIKEMLKGMKSNKYKIILDRKEAIKTTLSNSRDAVIVIAGKGAERKMKVKNRQSFSCNDFVSVLEWCMLNEQQLEPVHNRQKEMVKS